MTGRRLHCIMEVVPAPLEVQKRFCLEGSRPLLTSRLWKTWPPTEQGSGSTSKIGKKYTRNTKNPNFLCFGRVFCPILRVAVFSYALGGQVFPNLKARKAVSVFWPPFPLFARAFSPVVRHLFWKIPTEQALYYKNLGLYYGLASGTLPL